MAEVNEIDGGAEEVVDDATELGAEDAETAGPVRTAAVAEFWQDMRVDPVEIALPRGTGFTLRAYRNEDDLTMSEVDREEDDFTILDRTAAETGVDLDELDDEALAYEDEVESGRQGTKSSKRRDSDAETDESESEDEEDEEEDEDEEPDESEFDEDELEEDEEGASEEVPVFLSHAGQLLLFRSREGLVDFVRSEAEHDLTQLDSWDELRRRITPEMIAPDDVDRYELDLVVDNLRGGHEVWEDDLLIRAGEIARDLGYALRIRPVLSALAAGSPLDDLDEALRSAVGGGFGGFFAKRRLKKIGAQQAALGWRTIIGKVSAAVDWRE